MSKWRVRANELIDNVKFTQDYVCLCDEILYRLRCGSRRYQYESIKVRRLLRDKRNKVTKVLNDNRTSKSYS